MAKEGVNRGIMRVLLQRVSKARVLVEGQIIRQIGPGILVFVAIGKGDGDLQIQWMTEKILTLRIFDDSHGRLNLSLLETGGSVMVVSQFTLYGDCKKGRRPDFSSAAPVEFAKEIYEKFVQHLRAKGVLVETGIFQALMEVESTNDGPVTLWLDTPSLNGLLDGTMVGRP